MLFFVRVFFIFCLFASIVFLNSCGKPDVNDGFTQITFNKGDALTSPFSRFISESPRVHTDHLALDGGMMIYSLSDYPVHRWGAMKFDAVPSSSTIINFPNGDFYFRFFGWTDTAFATTSNNIRCGYAYDGAMPVALNGGTKTISVTMSQSRCTGSSDDYFFTDMYYMDESTPDFYPLVIHDCLTIGTPITDYTQCNQGASGTNGSTFVSYKIELASYRDDNYSFDIGAGISNMAKCIAASGTPGQASSAIKMPVGNTNTPFYTIITTYNAASCGGSEIKIFSFPSGILNGTTTAGDTQLEKDGTTLHLYLQE